MAETIVVTGGSGLVGKGIEAVIQRQVDAHASTLVALASPHAYVATVDGHTDARAAHSQPEPYVACTAETSKRELGFPDLEGRGLER